jgi:hypothetical protein
LPYTPVLGHNYEIKWKNDLNIAWYIFKNQIGRHRNYHFVMDYADPGFEQTSALFIKDLIAEDYPPVRRCVLYLNGKYMQLLLANEEDETDHIFDVVHNMANLLFYTDEI